MIELKIYISKSLNDRFRRIAMSVYGYGRGSLSKAAEDALSKWCEQHEQTGPSLASHPFAGTESTPSETPHVDPEERPGTLADTTAPENAGVKAAS